MVTTANTCSSCRWYQKESEHQGWCKFQRDYVNGAGWRCTRNYYRI